MPPPRIFHDAAGQAYPQAREIQLDGSNKGDDTGRIEPKDDVDFYTFVAQSNGEVEIIVRPEGGLVTNVQLFDGTRDTDGDGAPDGIDTDASDSPNGISYFRYLVTKGGRYYVKIESKDQNSIGRYELGIRTFDPNAEPPTDDGGSRGATEILPESARGVKLDLDGSGSGESRGFLEDPSGIRWFEIHGSQAGNMLVDVVPVNDDLKPFVTAFRADFAGIDTDSGEYDGTAKVGFQVAAGEIILVAVSSPNGRYSGGFTIHISHPDILPDDDRPDFGETAFDISPFVTQEGDGSIIGRIENPADDDWFKIPIRGTGFMTIQVEAEDSSLIPFLELNRDGTAGGFFESSDGRNTGKATFSYLPGGENFIWAKVNGLDGTLGKYAINVWRTADPRDDHPDSGGVFLRRRELPENGQIFVSGQIGQPGDSDNFHIRVDNPGHVAVQVIPLTEGMEPWFSRARQHADPNQRTGTSGGGSGRGGRAFEMLSAILPAPDNWIVIDAQAGNAGTTKMGDYIVHVRQALSPNDIDADTVGIEASPVLLDGSGNGSLPGAPNTNEPTPAIDAAGDVDVFQIVVAADRPITLTADGPGITGGVYLRVYDSSGNAIAGNHDSGGTGKATVTLEAFRGDLFYLEVSAFDGTSIGNYSMTVSQPIDDHPDVAIFQPQEGQTRDATVIAVNSSGAGSATGRIGSADENNNFVGDRDVFQFDATYRNQATVNVVTTDDTLDTYLRIYDSHGNLVAIDDDGGDGRNSSTTFEMFRHETYFAVVSGYGDQSIGAYEVSVQLDQRPRQLFVGTYDDFDDNSLSQEKWRASEINNATITESSGSAVLRASGNGSNNPDNEAILTSRANIAETIDFDFVTTLGDEANGSYIYFTNGKDFIQLLMRPDGSGGINLTIENSGYVELENAGTRQLSNGSSHHIAVRQLADTVVVLLDGIQVAKFDGEIKPNSRLQSHVNADRLPLYDDFNDNSIDGGRWNTNGEVVEEGGRLHLWMYRNGGLRYSEATTQNKPGGNNIVGFKLNSDRTAGTVGGGQAESEVSLTNGTDSIIIKWLNDVNQFVLRARGYYGSGDIYRWDPDEPGPAETPDGPLEIRQNGNDIEVLHNNTVQYTFRNKTVRPGSYFRAEAFGQVGENGTLNRDYDITIDELQLYDGTTRLAELQLDNVEGEFLLPDDAVAVLYDDFNDNQLDLEIFQIAGVVEEREGALKLPLFRNGQAVGGFVTTAGLPHGTNLRGFKLNTNRTTEPKKLSGWETNAWVQLTNGRDSIQVRHHLERKTFEIRTDGIYGTRVVDLSVPVEEIPDGPVEVRERDGNIEILHNNAVKLTIYGYTIRAGSWFEFETHGNPFGQSMNDPPQNFDVFIDNLQFYVDPQPYVELTAPSMATASDKGPSDTDHITNQQAVQVEWPVGDAGTQYQWRQGELRVDGTVVFQEWSAVQSATTAELSLAVDGQYIVSTRTISTDGFVGAVSARGFVVDTVPAAPTGFSMIRGLQPMLLVTFSEPVYGIDSDVVVQDSSGQTVTPTAVSGFGSTTLAVVLPTATADETYILTLNGTNSIADLAGNVFDGDSDGIAGGEYVKEFTPNHAPVADADSYSLPETGVLITTDVDGMVGDGSDDGVLVGDRDDDGDSLTARLITDVSFGILLLKNDGLFEYQHTVKGQFLDQFVYEIDDGHGGVSRATVTLNIVPVNERPALDPIGDQTISEGNLLTVSTTASDADLPADDLVFSLALDAPVGASIDTLTGEFRWTPTEAQGPGTYPITVVVTDDGSPALSDQATFVVTVTEVNVSPQLDTITDKIVDEQTELRFFAMASDADVPANNLVFSLMVGAPSGASINSTTGEFQWIPSESQGPGTFPITVVVTDDGSPSLSDQESFTVTVNEVNRPPVLAPIADRSVAEQMVLRFFATANDPDLPANRLRFSLAVGAPSGATIDSNNGEFAWTPTEAQGPGTYPITVVVTDDGSPALTHQAAFVVTVTEVNLSPQLDTITDKIVDEQTELRFFAMASDLDLPPNTLTFSLGVGAPTGAAIDSSTGEFHWTPSEEQGPATYPITVVVTDDGSPVLSEQVTFMVRVNEVNAAPHLDPIADMTVLEQRELRFIATASDVDIPANNLTFSLLSGPQGAVIDPQTGEFAWTPNANQVGTHPTTIEVSDGAGGLDSEVFSIEVMPLLAAPIVSVPVNPSIDSHPQVTWSAITGATDYVTEIFSRDRQLVVATDLVAGTSWIVVPALPVEEEPYEVTVRAFENGDLLSEWSTPTEFEIVAPPAPIFTGPVALPGTNRPTWTWVSVVEPDVNGKPFTYRLIVKDVATGQTVIDESGLSTTHWKAQSPLPDGLYQAFITGVNDAGDTGISGGPWEILINTTSPASGLPTPTGPGRYIYDATPTITWRSASNAVSYELLLYNERLGKLIANPTGITSTLWTTDPLTVGETFVAYVRANLPTGQTAYTGPVRFRVVLPTPPLPSPEIVTPPGTVAPGSEIRWTNLAAAAEYVVEVYSVSEGQRIRHEPGLHQTRYSLSADLKPDRYQFFVRGIDVDANGGSWQKLEFEVAGNVLQDSLGDFEFDQSIQVLGDAQIDSFVDFAQPDNADQDITRAVEVVQIASNPHGEETRVASVEPKRELDPVIADGLNAIFREWHDEEWWNQPSVVERDDESATAAICIGGLATLAGAKRARSRSKNRSIR